MMHKTGAVKGHGGVRMRRGVKYMLCFTTRLSECPVCADSLDLCITLFKALI